MKITFLTLLMIGVIVFFVFWILVQGKIPGPIGETGKQMAINLLEIVKNIWNNKILPLLQKIWSWIKQIWDISIVPRLQEGWKEGKQFLDKEIQKRGMPQQIEKK